MASGIFPADIIAAAQASHRKWDIPASVCLAQWALESAWGSSMPAGSNNPFGIKATPSQAGVATATHEDNGTHLVLTKARFRVFASIAEAFDQHGQLLAVASPYAAARKVRHDANAFADALTGVYATDHLYGAKLRSIMQAHNLYAYDDPASSIMPPPAPVAQTKPVPPVLSPGKVPVLPPVIPPSPGTPASTLNWLQRAWIALTFRKAA